MKSHPQTNRYVTCPVCQALNDRFATFCHECGTPIGTIATLDPIASIHTQGFLVRKAVDSPPKTIVLIGIWIMFMPVFLVSVCFAVYLVIYHHSFPDFFFFWGAVGLAYLSFVILYRVTRSFLSPRTDRVGSGEIMSDEKS